MNTILEIDKIHRTLIKHITPPKTKGERIVRIIDNFSYVLSGAPVQEVALELSDLNINATAVVNTKLQFIGIIKRATLENQLSKPYGRELLQRSTVNELMETAKTHQRDLNTAKIIQQRIIPHSSFFSDQRCEFICTALMQQEVGGDYYFVKQYAPHKWFFCLCDISGKGIAASLVVAVLAGYMWNANFSKSIVNFFKRLNKLILKTFNIEKFFTGIFCKFNSENGVLKYCDMGHGLMYLHSENKLIQIQSEAVNMPVGIQENLEVEKKELILKHNETLVLFSDGISEQENTFGEAFDIKNISHALSNPSNNLEEAKNEIIKNFLLFKNKEVQHDDISLLFCHRN